MVKKTGFSAKICEIEGKIPSINGLATSSALTAVETKTPDVTKNKVKFDTEVKKNNDKIASNISEALLYNNRLKQVKTRIDNLMRYAFYLRGKNYFDGDHGTQNALVFQE